MLQEPFILFISRWICGRHQRSPWFTVGIPLWPVGHFICRWDQSLKLKSVIKSLVWDLINMQNMKLNFGQRRKYQTKSLQLSQI